MNRTTTRFSLARLWPVLAIVTAIYVLDQSSKFFALNLLKAGESVVLVNNFLQLTLVLNTGAAFGMLKSQGYFFAALAVLAVFFINYLLVLRPQALRAGETAALSFVLGGTLGNLTDRIRMGSVIDFIDLRVWPVFNIADCFITIGAVVLGLSLLGVFGKKRETINR